MPERENRIKFVIIGLQISADADIIKEILTCKGFDIIKVAKKKSRRDG